MVNGVVAVGALNIVDDFRSTRWLTESIRSFASNVGSLVPATFGGYGRVFHPAYRCDGGQRRRVKWADIADTNGKTAHPLMQFTRLIGYPSRYSSGYPGEQAGLFDEAPEVGTLPRDVAGTLAGVLARHTTALDDCWFAVWDGWADLDELFHRRPTFALPQRNYYLTRGPLEAAVQSVGNSSYGRHRSCNLWWPEDHAWCVATEIDLDSTYVAASEACIDELAENTALEATPLDGTAGITADSDTLNRDC